MSGSKENTCRKFQANIFNKSKCQNCFKPRELHLLTDQDLNQAKPIYGGWLCLAPEGTDFDNPMQRSRKWQRRFFVLYEHGCLRFALDESPSTLPQGTVNMNQCTDVIDAEPKTGQKNALCIVTPEQEYFIRGENKELINGWLEQLVVYPKTNKQNQKKKRKVEPTTSQPGPAKVAVTGSGIPDAEKVPDSRSTMWQEELNAREVEASQVWPSSDSSTFTTMLAQGGHVPLDATSDHSSVNGDERDRGGIPFFLPQRPDMQVLSPTGSSSSKHSMDLGGIPRCQSPAQSDPFPSGSSLLSNGSHISGSMSSLDSDTSGSTVTSTDSHCAEIRAQRASTLHDAPQSRRYEVEVRKAEKRSRARSPERPEEDQVFVTEKSRPTVIEKFEALELENAERMETNEPDLPAARQGRSETRRSQREELKRDTVREFHCSTIPPLRRAKSLDRRTTESVMTPDLLNFKKGWMVKLDEQGQWKKYWFVLTDHSLRYYKDSIAEEASDLDGEIDLTACYNVTEYQVQRNYGFQIHTHEDVYTLSAMTAGIRRNWIQAVMKNVLPSTAPDVASLPDEHGSPTHLDALLKPDVTQDSPSSGASSVEREAGQKKSRIHERRREGRSKTFDWAGFRPIAQALAQQRASETDAFQSDLTDSDRTKRREERRKRYEMTSNSPEANMKDFESCSSSSSLDRQQKVQEEIEQHWQQVEKTPIREERHVLLATAFQFKETTELERLLESHKTGIEELKAQLESCHQQLADSNQRKMHLESQLRSALEREQQVLAGYISPLESTLGHEAELENQKQRQELLSSQAQSITKKYQETKELLQQQEIKRRSLQAQLGFFLSETSGKELSPTEDQNFLLEETNKDRVEELPGNTSALTIVLQDSADMLKEIESLLMGNPVSVKHLVRLLHSTALVHSEDAKKPILEPKPEITGKCCQKLYDILKQQHESLMHHLMKAEERVKEYEAHLEGMLGREQNQKLDSLKSCVALRQMEEHVELSEVTVKRQAQDIEILTNENEVLHQRYQEIMNQLTEADREIERLKLELLNGQGGQKHLQVVEELNKTKARLAEKEADKEVNEKELKKKSQKLQETIIRLEVLGSSLRETERKLQLREATLQGLGFQMSAEDDTQLLLEEKEQLCVQLGVAGEKLSEQEKQLKATEQSYRELQCQYRELLLKNDECKTFYSQKLLEAQNKIKTIEGASVEEGGHGSEIKQELSDEERVKQVVEKIKLESAALSKVAEVLGKVDFKVEKALDVFTSTVKGIGSTVDSSKEENPEMSLLKKILLEGEFWVNMSNISDTSSSELKENELNSYLSKASDSALVKNKMLFLAHRLFHLSNARQPPLELVKNPDKAIEEVVKDQTEAKGMLKFEVIEGVQSEMSTEGKNEEVVSPFYNWLDHETDHQVRTELVQNLQKKVCLLNQIASSIQASTNKELMSLSLKLFNSLDLVSNSKKDLSGPWLSILQDAVTQAQLSYIICRLDIQHKKELTKLKEDGFKQKATETDHKQCADLKMQNKEYKAVLETVKDEIAGLVSSKGEENVTMMHIHIEGEPIDSLDKAIEIQDMAAKHKKELREVKDAYELEAEKLRKEIAKAEEILKLKSEENVKEIDSLTVCMENLAKKHKVEMIRQQEKYAAERKNLEAKHTREIEKLQKEMVEQAKLGLPEGVVLMGEEGTTTKDNETHSTSLLKERIQELESQISTMRDAMKQREREGDLSSIQQKYEKDLENLKATCERGFAAMEESHQKVVEELQRKHHRELERLHEEKERLLNEETAATISAIEAMKNAHREELEKELDKARKANNGTENADIEEIRRQHDEELASFQREIEVLSEQYSQKCLENAHLAQALEAERQALRQCQRENQELNAHNQELNNRLAAEITQLRSRVVNEDGGDTCALIQGTEVYQLEVMLRVKESEVQYLKQEINSLKDELQAAQRDKKYTTDKYKDIYTELSIVKAKAERDLNRLKEQLQLAHEALGEQSLEKMKCSGYDIIKSKSNPDILKMAAAAKRSDRTMRSKSLKEGLTAEQRLHLFDNKDTKEF
ncbi:protein outspread-like isoform X2 [Polyodon spathula]|uniref:protein outspread-like isoform X2 n=1 Tax=Polyodon spathula TaxID=7913 RepID=UPI001B7E26E1|nr:protein outspread-like isoform X2 [Polyodon spathula]